MSIAATTRAWQAHVSPTCKLVLLALADRANAAGECFPSFRDLIERTGLAERTVRGALRDLERSGHVVPGFRAGRSTLYRLPELSTGGAADAPRQEMPPGSRCPTGGQQMPGRGARAAPITVTESRSEPSKEEAPRAASPAPDPKGSRLPADWQPSEPTFAGVNPAVVLPRFRDYWTAAPGAKGRKSDWQATWRNWCRREAEAPKPKLHTQSPAEQDRRILAAAGFSFSDPPLPVISLRIAR